MNEFNSSPGYGLNQFVFFGELHEASEVEGEEEEDARPVAKMYGRSKLFYPKKLTLGGAGAVKRGR